MRDKLEMFCSVLYRMIGDAGGEMSACQDFPEDKAGILRYLNDLKVRFPAEWIFAMEKVRSRRKRSVAEGEADFDYIRRALHDGKRVTVLMRHAERPPLDPSDTSFGEALPVTEYGKETSVMFGKLLAGVAGSFPVKVFCSRTFRTVQTACGILKGMGLEELPAVDDVLGSATPFFGSLEERMALIAEGRYMERLNIYFASGEQLGYRPLGPAMVEMEERLAGFHREASGLVIAVTHDINVASVFAGCGAVKRFDEGTWPHYLDAAVSVEDIFGDREYAVFRWP